jgi:hypothetical protein
MSNTGKSVVLEINVAGLLEKTLGLGSDRADNKFGKNNIILI